MILSTEQAVTKMHGTTYFFLPLCAFICLSPPINHSVMRDFIWPSDHASRVAALNDGDPPLFLNADIIQRSVIPFAAAVVVTLSLVYVTAYYLVVDHLFFVPHNDSAKKRKVSYQLTNALTNLCFGLAGLYYECTLPKNLPVEETARGFVPLVYFSAAQLGYQFWAIPLGIFYTGEHWPMIVHHFTVIVVSCMSGFLSSGFRYWTPFFYGLIELSSVPLAVMNCFKDNPILIKRYPTQYRYIRYLFAASFLYIRIVMFVPREYTFLRDQFLLFSTRSILLYQIFMGAVWLCAFILLLLQMFWASLILKGISAGKNNTSQAKAKLTKKLT